MQRPVKVSLDRREQPEPQEQLVPIQAYPVQPGPLALLEPQEQLEQLEAPGRLEAQARPEASLIRP